jgi:hypothetical protein
MNVPLLPRDMAGGFHFPNPGPITAMVPAGDVMWVYQPDHSYRMRSPDVIDPQRRNPNMRWAIEQALPYGSRRDAVARIIVGSHEMLHVGRTVPPLDTEVVAALLVSICNDVVSCEQACAAVARKVEIVVEQLRHPNAGRGHAAFLPQVEGLNDDVTTFLISAKRAIKLLCSLTALFLAQQDQDNNFDHLANRLDGLGLAHTQLVTYLRQCADAVRGLITLRNGQEHVNAPTRTVINNVQLMPDDTIAMPTWRLEGAAPLPPVAIVDAMRDAAAFLIRVRKVRLRRTMSCQTTS